MTPAVSLFDIVKRYGNVTAVSSLSLDAAQGEVVSLLGPNSSGKSTVLAIAAGLVNPTSGTVTINSPAGKDHVIGYVPQNPSFPLRLTCGDILQFHARLRRCTAEEIESASTSAGLPAEVRNRRSGDLSGGMLQRLALAVALIGNPALLLLDEASANLDPAASLGFRELVKQLRDQHCTILLATHELAVAAEVSDRVVVLVNGRQVSQMTGAELNERITASSGLLSPEQIYLEFVSNATV